MNDLTVTVQGKRWRLQFVKRRPVLEGHECDGVCDVPDKLGKRIRVYKGLKGQDRLETIIHELLHAGGWHRSEEYVEQEAKDLARILWRLGYRDESK